MYVDEIKFYPSVSDLIKNQHIRVAIIDLYNNEPNEGMRGIKSLLEKHPLQPHQSMSWKVYDVRFKSEVPDLDYDIYISTGGPGSPMPDENAHWEKRYFNFIDSIFEHNLKTTGPKKFLFLICHSFQLICRHLQIAEVTKRHSTAFGIFSIHKTDDGKKERFFKHLSDPFYTVDSRDYQVIQPDNNKLLKLGAKILAIEKERPHVSYERAVMAIRFTDEIFGTQFHPEADPVGMLQYLIRSDKQQHVIHHHGQEKYDEMMLSLNDDDKIKLTQQAILPSFLRQAIAGSLVSI